MGKAENRPRGRALLAGMGPEKGPLWGRGRCRMSKQHSGHSGGVGEGKQSSPGWVGGQGQTFRSCRPLSKGRCSPCSRALPRPGAGTVLPRPEAASGREEALANIPQGNAGVSLPTREHLTAIHYGDDHVQIRTGRLGEGRARVWLTSEGRARTGLSCPGPAPTPAHTSGSPGAAGHTAGQSQTDMTQCGLPCGDTRQSGSWKAVTPGLPNTPRAGPSRQLRSLGPDPRGSTGLSYLPLMHRVRPACGLPSTQGGTLQEALRAPPALQMSSLWLLFLTNARD